MNLLLFVAGVAIFLLSMQQMEQALATLGDRTLKNLIRSFTRTPVHGIILGTIATAILQSSSVVGLITLAFVGAGILTLRHAIGIILGANLGTTLTGWLVALLGFKLNLTDFYTLIMGGSALVILVATHYPRLQTFARFGFAFGLLLMSLLLMKDSVVFIVDHVDVARLQQFHYLVFFMVGVFLAAIIQSSSAVMIIALSALNANIITLEAGAALIVGADLGTTSTIILGATQGNIIKRQVAGVHFSFNLVIDLLAISFLPQLLYLVRHIYQLQDPLFSLVAIHSSFNFFGILLFMPFTRKLETFLQKLFPEKRAFSLQIQQVQPDIPEAAFSALDADLQQLFLKTLDYNQRCLQFQLRVNPETFKDDYRTIKHQEADITDYLLELQRQPLSKAHSERCQHLLNSVRDMVFSAKSAKEAAEDGYKLFANHGKKLSKHFQILTTSADDVMAQARSIFENGKPFEDLDAISLVNQINDTHHQMEINIYQLIDSRQLQESDAATALNINREYLLSMHALVNAMEHYLLNGREADTLANLMRVTR